MTKEISEDLHKKIARKAYRIDEVLQKIHNDSFVLPSFQRGFVWTLQQIIALFDSIMLGFPISTFIFWNLEGVTLSKNWFYPFYKELTFRFNGKSEDKEDSDQPIGGAYKVAPVAVLDGQQRLTGLFAALRGTVLRTAKGKPLKDAEEVDLYLDLASGANPLDDKGLGTNEDSDNIDEHERAQTSFTSFFKFRWDTKKHGKNWFKIKDVYNLKDPSNREHEMNKILQDVEPKIQAKAKENLETLTRRLFEETTHINGLILNQYEMNMALEIFVRFNSGGTKLEKAELVFSRITHWWDAGKSEVKQYLSKLNNGGKYSFDKMFLARLVLVLFGTDKNIKETDINEKIVNDLKDNWANIKRAINRTCRFLKDVGITDDRTLSSYTSIIPIIYSIYYNDGEVKNEKDIKKYIYRALMMNIFSRKSSTAMLLTLRNSVKNDKGNRIRISDIEEEINDFKVTPDRIKNIIDREKSFTTQLVLCLIVNSGDGPEIGNSDYHQDHIHALALFNTDKPPKDVSRPDWEKWRKMKNKLPNLRLLKGPANKSKSDKRLTEFTDAEKRRLRKELDLPSNLSLELKDFGKFYDCRKKNLEKKLNELLR